MNGTRIVAIVLMGGRRVQPFFFPDGFDSVAGLAGFALSALTGLWLLPFVMRTAFFCESSCDDYE